MALTYVGGKEKFAVYSAAHAAIENAPPVVQEAAAEPEASPNPGSLATIQAWSDAVMTAQAAAPGGMAAQLRALVRQVVETDPYEAEGLVWAARP